MRRPLLPIVFILVGLISMWPLHVAANDPTQQPRFGFRMDLQTFQDLRALAPELPQACFPSLTPEGQRAWETGLVTTVYNTGSYLEGDFDADGHADAALLLDEPVPNGPARRHVLLATRPLADGPWRRVALVRVADELTGLTVDQVLEHFAATPGSELAVFLSAVRPSADGDGKGGPIFSPDMAVEPRRSIDSWIAQLTDPDPHLRLAAAESLGEAGSDSAPTIDALVQRLYDPEEVVRDAAVQSLRRIGPGVVPALRALVEREGATLGRHDPGGRAQRLAVNLLGTLTPVSDAAVALAAEVCGTRTMHEVVCHDACVSLAQLGRQDPRVRPEAIRTLFDVVQEADAGSYLRTELIYQLAGLGPHADTVAVFAHLLQDREVFIRRAVAGALEDFSEEARLAIPDLEVAVKDPDADVRASAERAVKQLNPSEPPSVQPVFESAR